MAASSVCCPGVIVLLLVRRREECGELGVLWLICLNAFIFGCVNTLTAALVKSPQLTVVVGPLDTTAAGTTLPTACCCCCSSAHTIETRRALRLAASSSCQNEKQTRLIFNALAHKED